MAFDVVVAGAGPAGSAAAYHLARAGRSVLLLDKHTFPRPKICGDCLTPRGVRELSIMGALDKIMPLAAPTKGCGIFSTRGGATISAWPAYEDFPRIGLVISRTVLDELLKDHAVEAGAQFEAPMHVTEVVFEDGRVSGVRGRGKDGDAFFQARAVIGADGGDSVLARHVFSLHHQDARAVGLAFRAYFEDVKTAGDYMEIYGEDHVLPGCGWLFPMGDGRANVGVGIYEKDLRRRNLDWHSYFEEFISQSPWVRARLDGARRDGEVRGARLMMGGYRRSVVRPGVALAGDAAGLINPLTGEGMMYALESGRLAAEAINRSLDESGRSARADARGEPKTERALLDYQLELDRRFNRYFAIGCRMIGLAKIPTFVNPGVALLKKRKHLSETNLRYWTSIF
jgi:menaquinone-9 beta-reductase